MKFGKVCLLGIGLLLAGVTSAQEDLGISYDVNSIDPFTMEVFEIPESYKSLVPKNYRTKWKRITGFEYSGLHWGQFVVVYMNDHEEIYKNNYIEYIRLYVEDEELEDDEMMFQPYPVGTVFLKENYLVETNRPGAPSSLTLMVKKEPGYDPEFGDWLYMQSATSGQIAMEGKMKDPVIYKVCSECHANMAERDYIFSSFYNEPAGLE